MGCHGKSDHGKSDGYCKTNLGDTNYMYNSVCTLVAKRETFKSDLQHDNKSFRGRVEAKLRRDL